MISYVEFPPEKCITMEYTLKIYCQSQLQFFKIIYIYSMPQRVEIQAVKFTKIQIVKLMDQNFSQSPKSRGIFLAILWSDQHYHYIYKYTGIDIIIIIII